MGSLTSGVHRPYPAEAIEYAAWFPDDEACADYLAWLRWGDYEFGCHLCGTLGHGWRRAGGMLWDCGACRKQSSVTSGTLFDKTRTPLSVWFRAAWVMTTETYGVSARNLQRTLGMGSYQTAWMMLHRYRRAMVMPDRRPLEGVVEVDQMTVGGKNKKGKRGRAKDDNRAIVFAMAENPGESLAGGTGLGLGRARLVVLDDYSAPVLAKVMAENIAPDAHIVSDADGSIAAAALLLGHEHTSVATAHAPEPAHMLFPAVSRVQAQAKRWLASTPQGAVSAAHMADYLHEFEFRFNRRTSAKPGMLFYRLMEQAVRTDPLAYGDISKKGTRPRDIQPDAPTGPRSQPRSLTQDDAGRPWRSMSR